ncbi:hypothetical protein [Desulfuromonas sp. AOP6]|uniref:hypothetical protein n=1 Tax=Desulfuromonas sp. AOP6 TaxID=1566351 RepID=UPI0012DF3385|nr:hypothetical protein [Desulfuromonas sp. AOP6]
MKRKIITRKAYNLMLAGAVFMVAFTSYETIKLINRDIEYLGSSSVIQLVFMSFFFIGSLIYFKPEEKKHLTT